MSADKNLELMALKAQLTVQVKRVTSSINSASIQVVQDYKRTVVDINKALASSRTTAAKLQGLVRSIQKYA